MFSYSLFCYTRAKGPGKATWTRNNFSLNNYFSFVFQWSFMFSSCSRVNHAVNCRMERNWKTTIFSPLESIVPELCKALLRAKYNSFECWYNNSEQVFSFVLILHTHTHKTKDRNVWNVCVQHILYVAPVCFSSHVILNNCCKQRAGTSIYDVCSCVKFKWKPKLIHLGVHKTNNRKES